MNNPDITKLSNLKWYFDAAKNPPNFVDNMKFAIDGLEITDDMAIKFMNADATAEDLRTLLKSNIHSPSLTNDLFLLK